jgi:oligopeptide transport system substrate-binding protein
MLILGQGALILAQDSVTLDPTDPSLVTYYIHDGDVSIERDPQLAGSLTSVRTVDNLFLGLTDLSPETGEVRPELATEWSVSDDGLTWTFDIRTDVPWVSWNPETGEARVERMVNAEDIVTGTRRACNATLGGSYGPVTASFISGCSEVLASAEPDQALFEGVGVRAVDEDTVEFTLVAPTGFFPAVASLWTLRAVPGELIEEFGPEWIDVGNAWFNGPFLMESYTPGVGRTLIRNPFMPDDLRGPGNVDRVEIIVINDNSTLLSLYLNGQVDMIRAGGLPEGELTGIVENEELADQLLFITGTGIDYLSFNNGKPPFDNVYVRRAFSAAINREQIIADAAGGLGAPLIHITPPSMPAAPPIDEIGVGYDPDWAREQLAQSPYPGCEGFPDVFSVSQPGRRTLYVEFLVQQWATELGCDPAKFHNETIEDFSNMIPIISINNNMEDRPEWHPIGWGPDYPDANNWVGDILKCDIDNAFTSRPCSEVDDLIQQAREETDPATRSEMYAEIEEMFFGYDGIFPVAPIRLSATYALYQTYVDGPIETDGLVGGEHYDWYTIDQEAQSANRNG